MMMLMLSLLLLLVVVGTVPLCALSASAVRNANLTGMAQDGNGCHWSALVAVFQAAEQARTRIFHIEDTEQRHGSCEILLRAVMNGMQCGADKKKISRLLRSAINDVVQGGEWKGTYGDFGSVSADIHGILSARISGDLLTTEAWRSRWETKEMQISKCNNSGCVSHACNPKEKVRRKVPFLVRKIMIANAIERQQVPSDCAPEAAKLLDIRLSGEDLDGSDAKCVECENGIFETRSTVLKMPR
jgi:hypothetical protein